MYGWGDSKWSRSVGLQLVGGTCTTVWATSCSRHSGTVIITVGHSRCVQCSYYAACWLCLMLWHQACAEYHGQTLSAS